MKYILLYICDMYIHKNAARGLNVKEKNTKASVTQSARDNVGRNTEKNGN